MQNYLDTGAAMRLHAWHFAGRVFLHYTSSLGTTFLGYFAPFIAIALTFVIALTVRVWKEGRSGFRAHIRHVFSLTILPSAIAFVLIYGAIFSWAAVSELWTDHYKLVIKTRAQTTAIADLNNKLIKKVYEPNFQDPEFKLLTGLNSTFMNFRYAIGPDAHCWILTTEPSETIIPGMGNISMTVISAGVPAARCPNGNLRNIGVPAQDVEAKSSEGNIDGTLIFHALADQPGAETLFDALRGMFTSVKRSYTFPAPVRISDNVIWLQFGKGVKWRTEP